MSPLIFLRNGKVVGVIGASGGSRIISSILNVVVRAFVDKQDPLEAVNAARVHHQLIPSHVEAEKTEKGSIQWSLGSDIKEYLEAKV